MFTRETDFNKITGTSLKGHVRTTKARLVQVFGKPQTDLDEDKIGNHWILTFTRSDGTKAVASIYDWKLYRDIGWEETYDWHIGGHTSEVVADVLEALNA